MKIIYPLALAFLTACSAQKQQNMEAEYITISYSSICCGTPSGEPVSAFVEAFSKKNKISHPKTLKNSGLGREGEYDLFIDIGGMKKEQKTAFVQQLQQTIEKQNHQRDATRDGLIYLNSKAISQKEIDEKSKNSHFPIVEINEIKHKK